MWVDARRMMNETRHRIGVSDTVVPDVFDGARALCGGLLTSLVVAVCGVSLWVVYTDVLPLNQWSLWLISLLVLCGIVVSVLLYKQLSLHGRLFFWSVRDNDIHDAALALENVFKGEVCYHTWLAFVGVMGSVLCLTVVLYDYHISGQGGVYVHALPSLLIAFGAFSRGVYHYRFRSMRIKALLDLYD